MPDKIDQTVPGSGHVFSGTGNVHVEHHHYPPGSAPPSQPPSLSNKFDLSRLPTTDSALFGREDELALIDRAWQESGTNVLVLTAMGGAGKTSLLRKWIDDKRYRGADAVYTWSFYLCRDQAVRSRLQRLNSLTTRWRGSVMTAARSARSMTGA